MSKRIIIISLLVISTVCGFAQNDSLKSNSIFIELGGVGGHFSINYDRTINFNNNFGLIAGIGFSPSLIDMEFSPRLPIQLKMFYQIKKHTIEMGTALTPYVWYDNYRKFSENLKDMELAIFGQIGYKYSIIRQRFYVGIAFTPLIYDIGDFDFYPWGALRFGYKF